MDNYLDKIYLNLLTSDSENYPKLIGQMSLL